MESLTIQISQRAYDGFAQAAIGNGQTVQGLINEFCQNEGTSYADIYRIGIVSNATLILRLTEEELIAIRTAAFQSLEVAGLLSELEDNPEVHLDDPRLLAGLQQLVLAGLLNQGRIAVLLAYDRPQPTPEIPAE